MGVDTDCLHSAVGARWQIEVAIPAVAVGDLEPASAANIEVGRIVDGDQQEARIVRDGLLDPPVGGPPTIHARIRVRWARRHGAMGATTAGGVASWRIRRVLIPADSSLV